VWSCCSCLHVFVSLVSLVSLVSKIHPFHPFVLLPPAFSFLFGGSGAGSTTLLATVYGLPISATHSIVGGLVAVGLAARGAASLGLEAIVKTMVAWVAR
jgi:phosphate/sulfate permease